MPYLFANTTALVLAAVSLATLILGLATWRLTSSRSIVFNALLCSGGLLFAAWFALKHEQIALTFVIPFFVTMISGGRAIGLWWRSRVKESELLLPAILLFAATGLSLGATIVAYCNQ